MPKDIPPATFRYHSRHNSNVSCAFHVGYIGHSSEDFLVLKAKLQEVIDHKVLSFSKEKPNMKTNPLPVHNGPVVNAIIEYGCTEVVKEVNEVKTLMTVVVKKL